MTFIHYSMYIHVQTIDTTTEMAVYYNQSRLVIY